MHDTYRPYTTYKSNLRRRPRNEMQLRDAPIDWRLVAILSFIGSIVIVVIGVSI